MDITDPKFDNYILNISLNAQLAENEQLILREMEEYARTYHFPIIGPIVGRFLRQLAIITGAKRVFEMGSGYGYSAAWFAGGMENGGRIICTDGVEDNKKRARGYFKRLGYNSKVEYHIGDARDIIRETSGPFDIILNDIDKEQYPEALELAVSKLRKGGIFITDNVLWSGRIFDNNPGESTRGILDFNNRVFNAQDLFSSIIPIRDGLALAVKL
jgi:caffeoyl-CoA O-methyltransferase